MTNQLLEILLPILSTLLVAVAGVVVFVINRYKKLKEEKDNQIERMEQLKELCNYICGLCDAILNENVEMRPDLKQQLSKALKRYHKLDLTKEE